MKTAELEEEAETEDSELPPEGVPVPELFTVRDCSSLNPSWDSSFWSRFIVNYRQRESYTKHTHMIHSHTHTHTSIFWLTTLLHTLFSQQDTQITHTHHAVIGKDLDIVDWTAEVLSDLPADAAYSLVTVGLQGEAVFGGLIGDV